MKPLHACSRLSRWIAAAVLAVNASSSHGAYKTIVNNGPSSNRVDMVVLGDGYTAANIAAGVFQQHVAGYIDYMFADSTNSDPFHRYRNFFNIHTVDVISNQSGADIPPEGVFRNTALDAKYYGDGQTERLLVVNDTKANLARNAALVGAPFTAEMQYVTVNASKYGGSGGTYAVFAGDNYAASEIALHEVAHSFSNLADEYGGNSGSYSGAEPGEVNVSKNSSGAKWSQWLGYQQEGIGTIGAYQGGKYYDTGIYRPSINSKMRNLGNPFDAVSREKIILDIYKLVNPFDSWSTNNVPLTDPGLLFVDVIDDSVINVEWFVDDELVPGAAGTSFALSDFGYGPGDHLVTARGYDPTGFDPVDGWVRKNQQMLEQFVTWQVTLSTPTPNGDFDANGTVDGNDFLFWQRGFGIDDGSADLTDGDADGDGSVDDADLQLWKEKFGEVSTPQGVATPEPEGLSLTAVAAICGVLACRIR